MRNVLAVVLCLAMPIAMLAQEKPSANPTEQPTDDKARVFITDSESWSIAGSGGGTNGTYGSHMSGGARPQTAEIVKTFGERCPQVVTNNKQERADYIVVLDHEGGKGVLRHKNKVAVFNHVSGDNVMSKSTLSLGGSVQEACEAITADWKAHSQEIRAAEAAAIAPAPAKMVTAVAQPDPPKSSSAQLTITSDPMGADIEVDGNFVGDTPSSLVVATGSHEIAIKKAGFKPWGRRMMISGGQISVNAGLEPEAK